jgi:diguanylate cyclase (GGDEF)-like protein
MIDIDNFKQVNDRLGHDCGDLVLQKVAGQLTQNIRNVDFVARLGGEEFVVVLPETDLKGALEVGSRLRSAVRNNAIETAQGPLTVTVSVGVGSGVLAEVDDHKQMIQDADHALYVAKRSGKDRVETLRLASDTGAAAAMAEQRI